MDKVHKETWRTWISGKAHTAFKVAECVSKDLFFYQGNLLREEVVRCGLENVFFIK